jgi:hypothetical protein
MEEEKVSLLATGAEELSDTKREAGRTESLRVDLS